MARKKVAAKTTRKPRQASKTVISPKVETKQPATRVSQTTLFWLAVFFVLVSILMVMVYIRQVEEAQQLIEFRRSQDKVLYAPQPEAVEADNPQR